MKQSQKRRLITGIILSFSLIGCIQLAKKSSVVNQFNIPKNRARGNPKAKVVLYEFSDFQCPSCRRAQDTVHQLLENYPDDLLIVFKHYPLEMHPWAKQAAKASECAREQKKFWEYHDQLFSQQDIWPKATNPNDDFERIAKELALDLTQFKSCLNDPRAEIAVKSDITEGDARQVSSTPSFFLGEFRLVGASQLNRDGARLIELLRHEKTR